MEKYPELTNLKQVAKVLDELKISYYITGGFAISIYGRPRFTADIDIVIKMQKPNAQVLAQKLLKVFPKGYVDLDLIHLALESSGEFNIIDPETGLKIDFFVTKDNEFEKSCFKRAQKKDFGYGIHFISPEDLIISKLLWFKKSESTRQLEDVQSVLDIQEEKIDQKYVDHWLQKLDLGKEWSKLKKLL